MLEISKITLSNYYSIGSVEFPINRGLHYIVGINNDTETTQISSNGSGKTATFSGVYQGLFNKNIKNTKAVIDSVNNSVTGKPYSISVEFTKNGVDKYQVVNDRNNNKIDILKEGQSIAVKGIPNQLKQIKDILGLDFETFSALTYISQSTLHAILDTTNKDNILYQFFDVESINKAESLLKDERKDLKNLRAVFIAKLRGAEKNLSLLTSFERIDVDSLESNLNTLQLSLLALSKDSRHLSLKTMDSRISIFKESIITLNGNIELLVFKISELTKQINKFSDGICPTCNTKVELDIAPLKFDLSNLQEEKSKKLIELNVLTESLSKVRALKDELSLTLSNDEKILIDKINIIKSKLLIVAEQNSQYERIAKQQASIEDEIKSIGLEMDSLDINLGLVEQVLALIKNGTLVNEYLNKFKKVFITVLKDLVEKTNFNINILVSVTTGKLEYKFFDRGIEKGYNDLSAGERTRVSLVLLISTIFTLEKVTGFSSNYLVIDEMLGVLDEEGIEMVKKFLDIIRQDKAVYIITHHEEISVDFFDTMITFTKTGGITSLSEIQNLKVRV